VGHDAEFTHTRSARIAVDTAEEVLLEGIEDVEADHVSNPDQQEPEDYDVASSGSPEMDEEEDEDDDVYDIESCDCSEKTDEEEDDGEEPEPFAWATFSDVPVVTTVMEVCEGTFYDLIKAHPEPEKHVAWVSQVVFALAYAQRTFGLTHNDLHGNNVMYVKTDREACVYLHAGTTYRVPTFGYLMKIIDFGRATFRPPPASAKAITPNHVWFSDAFAPHADAGGQYNCGPYFEQGKPKVKPNPSFDLCRLAVSILDTLWPTELELVTPNKVLTREPGRIQHETKSPLWNLLWLWLTDKSGKNILYSPDGSERYPQFDLYCAIAKDAQNAVPAQQLTLPLFDSAFKCRRKDIPADAPIWKLAARI
jgi:hypothetical protein